jgi:thioredoxin-related protein
MQKVIATAFIVLVLPFAWSFVEHGSSLQGGEQSASLVSPGRAELGVLPAKEKIKWISLAEAEKIFKVENKTVLIDLYTDWCSWCKVMDKKTYSDPDVVRYINEHFLPVKLDAESKEKISWLGKEYHYQPSSRMNAFAVYLTRGNLSFPTTVFIPASEPDPLAVPGFLEPRDIEGLLKYFGDGHFGKTSFDVYIKKFESSWK